MKSSRDTVDHANSHKSCRATKLARYRCAPLTSFVSATQVIAQKAGKRAQTGDALKVRNPDGSETQVLNYTRVNCSP